MSNTNSRLPPDKNPYVAQSTEQPILNIDNYDNYFLSISHGESIGVDLRYFEIPITSLKIEKINIFGTHGDVIYLPDIGEYPALIQSSITNNYVINEPYLKLLTQQPHITLFDAYPIQDDVSDPMSFPISPLMSKVEKPPTKSGIFKFYLPSLGFAAYQSDESNPLYREYMGLWLYKKNTQKFEKIYNIQKYIELTKQYGGSFTYSIIIDLIKKYVNEHKLTGTNSIGFFCCRSPSLKYQGEYNDNIPLKGVEEKNMYPSISSNGTSFSNKMVVEGEYSDNSIIIEPTTPDLQNLTFTPLYIKTPVASVIPYTGSKIAYYASNTWTGALGNLTVQGCALNVLTFYRFMLQTMAREKTFCLSLVGTSIFRIIDYLHFYLTHRGDNYSDNSQDIGHGLIAKRLGVELVTFKRDMETWMSYANISKSTSFPLDTKYIVLRFPVINIWDYLQIYLSYPNIENCTVIVKFYKELRHNYEYSHRGHTVSFYYETAIGASAPSIYLVDPQSVDFMNYLQNPITYEWIKNYMTINKFTFFDTIWYNSDELKQTYENFKLTKMMYNIHVPENEVGSLTITRVDNESESFYYDGYIIPRGILHHGGKRSVRKSRKIRSLRRKKRSTIRRGTERSKQQTSKTTKSLEKGGQRASVPSSLLTTNSEGDLRSPEELGVSYRFSPDYSHYSKGVIAQLRVQEERNKNNMVRLLARGLKAF